MMEETFDIIIIGSGLGGLVCANILLKEGYKVLVLEKNNKLGGNLQTFSRDKRIFDTGVHYIGSLEEGEVLYKIFDYLGIIKELKLKKMDEKFDLISFDNDPNEYPVSQGKENFINNLLEFFPEEKQSLQKYMELVQEYVNHFPLHNLKSGNFYLEENIEIIGKKADEVINSITQNEKLRAVLSGINFLYAGEKDKTPFYIHALILNTYIKSSWRCVKGGSQIAKLLGKKIKEKGGKIVKNAEVENIFMEDEEVKYLQTSDGRKFYARRFISNIDAKKTVKLMKGEEIKKSFQKRIFNNKDTISSFSLFLTLKPGTIPYKNYNYYHYKNADKVWEVADYSEENWPENYMISFGTKTGNDEFAEEMTILAYMKYDEVKQWEDTFHTVSHKNSRGEDYEKFKEQKAEILLKEVEKKIPDIRNAIINTYVSTPLTYRDYMGTSTGGMYGFVKNANNPLQSFLTPRTKIKNLLLSGQSIGLHGIFGVAIGGILTCSELIDRDYLISKINS